MVIVGGAGDMAAVAGRVLGSLRSDVAIVLADRDAAKAQRRAGQLGRRVTAEALDVVDPGRLREVVRGADLVVNATGPGYLTAVPVLEACIDERVDYIDFGDTIEAADLCLALDRPARQAGVTAVIGAGVAPGLVNIAVRGMVDQLDVAEAVQLAWVTGATPARPGTDPHGRAVIEHMIHSCAGVTVTVEDGRRQTIPAFRRSEILAFPPPLGPVPVYDIGHAELATIPRFLPTVRRVRTQGAVHPAALNGVFQGLGAAVASGRLGWEAAVEFGLANQDGDRPRMRGVRAAFGGVARQVVRGELGPGGLADAIRLARGDHDGAGGLYVRVDGQRDDRPAGWQAAVAMTQTAGAGGMDAVTGSPLAILAHLMLTGRVHHPGVVATEAAVKPADVIPMLDSVGMAETTPLFTPAPVDPATHPSPATWAARR